MGLMSWSKDVWENDLIGKAVKATVQYSYKTVAHLFEQIGVFPKVTYSLATHQRSREISKNIAYIAFYDLLPMVLVNAANDAIQRAAKPILTDDQEDDNWISSPYLISSSLHLLHYAVQAYNFRQGLQMTTRTLLVSLNAPDAFNQIAPRPQSVLCIEEKCTIPKQITSGGLELVGLIANDMAVISLRQIPWMEPVGQLVSMYVRGRYILKSTTPERCPAHRGIASENALALGIGHELMMTLLKRMLSSTTGLPPVLCLDTMDKILLVFQMAVAAHLHPPLVKPGEGLLAFDPLEAYEKAVGWLTEVFVSGILKHPPAFLFGGPGMDFPWEKISRMVKQLNHHPLTGQLKVIALPPLLRSDKDFVRDPVIRQLWSPLQKQIDSALTFILTLGRNDPIKFIATYAPKMPMKLALKMTLGVPQKLTQAVIDLVSDPQTCDSIEAVRNWIQRLNPDIEVKLVSIDKSRPSVRKKTDSADNKQPKQPFFNAPRVVTDDMLGQMQPGAGKEVAPEELLYATKPTFFGPGEKTTGLKNRKPILEKPEPSIEDLLGLPA